MVYLKKKLQILKQDIKTWSKEARKSSFEAKLSIQKKLSDVDKVLDQGGYSEGTLKSFVTFKRASRYKLD